MAKNAVTDWNTDPNLNTDIAGINTAEGWAPSNVNNAFRAMMAQVRQALALQGSDIASAATVNIGAANCNYLRITGTTTITAFDSIVAGKEVWVEFTGALTLTHNATSLILPGAANITTAAGDIAKFISKGSGNWKCADYIRASGLPVVNPTVLPPMSHIAGLLPTSIAGTSTTASLTITAGQAADSTTAAMLSLSSNQAWAVSNGNAINGYQGGTTLPNSTTIHFFICNGASGTGTFASTSLTPTLPAGYNTYYRRIFSLLTDGSGVLRNGAAIEMQGGSMWFYLATQVLDVNGAATTTASRTLYTLTVPTGIKVMHLGRYNGIGQTQYQISSPDETDTAATSGAFDWQGTTNYAGSVGIPFVTTNTSGQVGIRTALVTTVNIQTRGWVDTRR